MGHHAVIVEGENGEAGLIDTGVKGIELSQDGGVDRFRVQVRGNSSLFD